jgi:hypothetical protein
MDRVKYARSFIGVPYRQEQPRSGWDEHSLRTIDCSELVMRVLNLDGHMKDKPVTTELLKSRFSSNEGEWIKSDRPEIGDVVLWRSETEGHTAIVTDVRDVSRTNRVKDPDGKIVFGGDGKPLVETTSVRQYRITHAAGTEQGTVESKWIDAGKGSTKPLIGYFRPRDDTPDILTQAEEQLTPLQYHELRKARSEEATSGGKNDE